jgi:hypothetical protein
MSSLTDGSYSFTLSGLLLPPARVLNLGQLSTDPTAVEFFAQDLMVQILSPVRFSTTSWTWKTNGLDLFSSA